MITAIDRAGSNNGMVPAKAKAMDKAISKFCYITRKDGDERECLTDSRQKVMDALADFRSIPCRGRIIHDIVNCKIIKGSIATAIVTGVALVALLGLFTGGVLVASTVLTVGLIALGVVCGLAIALAVRTTRVRDEYVKGLSDRENKLRPIRMEIERAIITHLETKAIYIGAALTYYKRIKAEEGESSSSLIIRNLVVQLDDKEFYKLFMERLSIKLPRIDWNEFHGVWEDTNLELVKNLEEPGSPNYMKAFGHREV